jgi:type IX secretion system PorP/SprF family membrane protein
MFNGVALNPAFTGSENTMSVVGSFRFQWTGVNGAPSTQSLTAHAPLKKNNNALGIQVFNDQIGVERNTGIFGLYSYRIKQSKGALIFGVKGGVNFRKIGYSKLNVNDLGDTGIETDTPLGILPNFSFGMHYFTKKYFVSFAIPTLVNHKFDANAFKISNNYNLTFGAGVVLNSFKNIEFKPSFLMKYNTENRLQFDLNLMTKFNEGFSLGASYRTKEAIIFLFNIEASKQLSVMYSFGLPINKLLTHTYGSHELSLKYTFLYKTNISNPRVLGW